MGAFTVYQGISIASAVILALLLPPLLVPPPTNPIKRSLNNLPALSLVLAAVVRSALVVLESLIVRYGPSTHAGLLDIDAILVNFFTTVVVAHLPVFALLALRTPTAKTDRTRAARLTVASTAGAWTYASMDLVAILVAWAADRRHVGAWWGMYAQLNFGWWHRFRAGTLLAPLGLALVLAAVVVYKLITTRDASRWWGGETSTVSFTVPSRSSANSPRACPSPNRAASIAQSSDNGSACHFCEGAGCDHQDPGHHDHVGDDAWELAFGNMRNDTPKRTRRDVWREMCILAAVSAAGVAYIVIEFIGWKAEWSPRAIEGATGLFVGVLLISADIVHCYRTWLGCNCLRCDFTLTLPRKRASTVDTEKTQAAPAREPRASVSDNVPSVGVAAPDDSTPEIASPVVAPTPSEANHEFHDLPAHTVIDCETPSPSQPRPPSPPPREPEDVSVVPGCFPAIRKRARLCSSDGASPTPPRRLTISAPLTVEHKPGPSPLELERNPILPPALLHDVHNSHDSIVIVIDRDDAPFTPPTPRDPDALAPFRPTSQGTLGTMGTTRSGESEHTFGHRLSSESRREASGTSTSLVGLGLGLEVATAGQGRVEPLDADGADLDRDADGDADGDGDTTFGDGHFHRALDMTPMSPTSTPDTRTETPIVGSLLPAFVFRPLPPRPHSSSPPPRPLAPPSPGAPRARSPSPSPSLRPYPSPRPPPSPQTLAQAPPPPPPPPRRASTAPTAPAPEAPALPAPAPPATAPLATAPAAPRRAPSPPPRPPRTAPLVIRPRSGSRPVSVPSVRVSSDRQPRPQPMLGVSLEPHPAPPPRTPRMPRHASYHGA